MRKKMKQKLALLIVAVMVLTTPFATFNSMHFAVAEDNFSTLYAIPSVSNPYEQTLNSFTLNYCYPAQLLNQTPTIRDGQEDPNGLTWVIFVPSDGVVQLTGKDDGGKWKCATWTEVGVTEMLFVCYCLCEAFGSVYKDNEDFAICLYSDSGEHSYIANKASADSFMQMIDNRYGGEQAEQEIQDDPNAIGRGTNDPVIALFPGIEWGMKKNDMLSKYGPDKIIDTSSEERTACVSLINIYDEDVMIMFSFEDDMLKSITAIYSEEKAEKYLADMTKDYGKPARTSSLYAYSDEIIEVKDGDMAIWKTENSIITVSLREAGYTMYRKY